MRHIIESQQFNRALIEKLFALADQLGNGHGTELRGKIMASLFYEPSTRTRFSFESAMMRLGGNVLTTENAKEFSSAAKGETLEDTIKTVNNYADVIVLRHNEEGASKRAAAVSEIPVINAGDGPGQHPTQALLDLYTIAKELGRVDDVRIAFVGDLLHSRTVRSLAYLLGKFTGVHMTLVSPNELRIKDDIKAYLKRHHVSFEETEDLTGAMKTANVVYQNRIQKERFEGTKIFDLVKSFVIDRKLADSMKKGAVILNPLPRVGELLPEVDDSPHAAYFKQMGYGVAIRKALLAHVLS